MWPLVVLAVLWLAGLSYWRGWRRGKAAGDDAHAQCHQATAALARSIIESLDVAAWEEEL